MTPTNWPPYCIHVEDGGVISTSEVSGSGMHFLVPISDSGYPFLAPKSPFLTPDVARPHLDSNTLLT